MDKKAKLLELARKRQAATNPEKNPNPWKGYKNLCDHGGVYECDFVSPYTKSAGNVDASVMVFLQDWSSDNWLKGAIHQDSVTLGYETTVRTNINLIKLLKRHFGLALTDIYATNLFPFIKLSRTIPQQDMIRAAKEYGLPQLEIVNPKSAICLGHKTFNALRKAACGLDPLTPMAKAIASPFCHGESIIFCQAHTNQQALNTRNRGDIDRVPKDWSRMVSCYNAMPENRAELNEWFRKWQASQQ